MVNKQLGKPEYTEMDSIAFYHRLGDMGRSPVWTPEDIQSHYFEFVLKYGLGTLAVAGLAGGLAYYFTQKS
jgi:hypothetical protein